MRELNQNEISAVSGGTFKFIGSIISGVASGLASFLTVISNIFKPKPAVPAAPKAVNLDN